MENFKADNIAEKFFLQKLLEIGWVIIMKRLYKGLSINNCSVDVSAIKNTSLKQQIHSKIPAISAVQVFSTELHS